LPSGSSPGRRPLSRHPRPRRARQPSIGQIAGHALSSVFLDNLGADLERLYQVNRLLRVLPEHEVAQADFTASNVDVFVLFPSRDLGAFALRYADRLPRGVHYLLRGHGSTQGTGSNLLSYLLFDREFARALIKLGYDDAMARRDELSGFLDGTSAGYVAAVSARIALGDQSSRLTKPHRSPTIRTCPKRTHIDTPHATHRARTPPHQFNSVSPHGLSSRCLLRVGSGRQSARRRLRARRGEKRSRLRRPGRSARRDPSRARDRHAGRGESDWLADPNDYVFRPTSPRSSR
jgi:hypothetical protein